jgi:hypothetical protein
LQSLLSFGAGTQLRRDLFNSVLELATRLTLQPIPVSVLRAVRFPDQEHVEIGGAYFPAYAEVPSNVQQIPLVVVEFKIISFVHHQTIIHAKPLGLALVLVEIKLTYYPRLRLSRDIVCHDVRFRRAQAPVDSIRPLMSTPLLRALLAAGAHGAEDIPAGVALGLLAVLVAQ